MTRFDATDRRPVDKWTAAPRPTTSPQGQKPQQKRSTHLVHKPVNSECSRHPAARSANGLLTDHSAVAFERGQAFDAVRVNVDRFCLLAGIEALQELMEEDVASLCGPVHRHDAARTAYRWGTTVGELGYHGGKVKVPRPRVRDLASKEAQLPSWVQQ